MADVNTSVNTMTPWNTATFTKPDVTAAGSSGAWTTANSPIVLATVTGLVLLRVFGEVTASFTSTGATGTLALGSAGLTNGFMGATTVNGTVLQTGYLWGSSSRGTLEQFGSTAGAFLIANTGTINLTIATNNMTAGGAKIYFQWIALSAGATVVAATP